MLVSASESLMSKADLTKSLDFLTSCQLDSGMIPWFKGGRADTWNHTEGAIALALGGRIEEALEALDWLKRMQNIDGSWSHFYLSNGVAEPRRDTNTCSYPVVLVALMDSLLGDNELLAPFIEMAFSSIDFVMSHQSDHGSIPWAVDPGGDAHQSSLVAAASSIRDSFSVAAALAEKWSDPRSIAYCEASLALMKSITLRGPEYRDNSDWAMDRYYPHLAAVEGTYPLTGEFLDLFYVPEWGVRCRLPNNWFTAAETAEAAMAFHLCGELELAEELYSTLDLFRTGDGGYLTGLVSPSGESFPHQEKSAYSLSAVVIASYVLAAKPAGAIGDAIVSLGSRP